MGRHQPDFATDASQNDLHHEMRESGSISPVYVRDSTDWRLVTTLVPVEVMAADTVDLSSVNRLEAAIGSSARQRRTRPARRCVTASRWAM